MTTPLEALNDLDRRWTEAEVGGDPVALDRLATDDFTLVGPLGFVLSKEQWLDRYRAGDLRTRALSFAQAATRVYGATAITVGRQTQEAAYRERPVNGEFRVTRIAVRDDRGWRLAGLHLSPIAGVAPAPGLPAR